MKLCTLALLGATATSAFQPTSFSSSSPGQVLSQKTVLNAVAIDPTSAVNSPLGNSNNDEEPVDLSGIALSVRRQDVVIACLSSNIDKGYRSFSPHNMPCFR